MSVEWLPANGAALICHLATMLVIGLWHGFAWTFVAWGVWHGAGSICRQTVGRLGRPRARGPSLPADRAGGCCLAGLSPSTSSCWAGCSSKQVIYRLPWRRWGGYSESSDERATPPTPFTSPRQFARVMIKAIVLLLICDALFIALRSRRTRSSAGRSIVPSRRRPSGLAWRCRSAIRSGGRSIRSWMRMRSRSPKHPMNIA